MDKNNPIRVFAARAMQQVGLYQQCVKISNYFRSRRLAKAFHKYGLDMMCRADKVLSENGITFFPTCGVLLGAYREHNFIAYDCDLDCGVLSDSCTPQKVQEILSAAGFELTLQQVLSSTNQITEERYTWQGVQMDLFYYFENSESYYCYFPRHHEYKEWRQANCEDGFPAHRSIMPHCNFERCNFLGHQFLMPTKVAEWLAGMYGESFMTPIKNWEAKDYKTTTIDCGNRVYRKYPPFC